MGCTVKIEDIGDFHYYVGGIFEGFTFGWNRQPRMEELTMLKQLLEFHGAKTYDTWAGILEEIKENGNPQVYIPTTLTQKQVS